MPQIGGKNAKKSSKTKSSSTSKRHFTVVIGTKEHGLYCSSSPSSAARKAVSKLCGKEKGKKVEFCLREITQGSKKKTYGPYLGHIEKLANPIELKGRVIERKPVALLKPKSSAKKGGMRGGGKNNNEGTEMRNMSPIPTINMNNVYTKREKEFMNDYEYTLNPSFGMSGQSPQYLIQKYHNMNSATKEKLEEVVKEKLRQKGVKI
jgi:hypothetical protein